MPGPIILESVSVAARRLSNFLARQGATLDSEDALAIARGAVALAPVSESYNALAGVLNDIPGAEQLQVDAAEAAIAEDSENWAAWHNLSLALLRLNRGQEAAQAISHALRLLPAAEANPYLAMQAAFVAGIRGKHEQALGYLDEAEQVAERLAASGSPSQTLLAQTVQNECTIARFVAFANMGDWPRAFAALTLRHATSPARNVLTLSAAAGRLWVPGTEPKHKDVIVVLEWGLGDQIQFARFVPELVKRGVFASVSVACSAPLQSLIRTLDGVVACMDRDALTSDALDSYDIVPGLDLMADYWKRTGDPVGGALGGKYLSAPGNSKPEFSRDGGKLALAFSWQGDPRQTHDWSRRLPLADFGAWAAIARDRFTFVSVQTRFAGYGEPWAGWPDDVPVEDASASLVVSDMGDVADWIEAADVFVGQCGGLVHLAGALGKPGVVMLAASHDWRWDQNPRLYESITPVEQSAPGDWPSAFSKLAYAIDPRGVVPPPLPPVEVPAEAPATASAEPAVDPLAAPAETSSGMRQHAAAAADEAPVKVELQAESLAPLEQVPAVAEPEPNFAHMGDEETAAYLARKAAVAPAPVVEAEYPAAVEPVGTDATAPAPVITESEQPAESAAISPTEGETQQ